MTPVERFESRVTECIIVLGIICLILGAMSCHVHYHVTIKTDDETPHQKPKNEMTYYQYPHATLQGKLIIPDSYLDTIDYRGLIEIPHLHHIPYYEGKD